MKVLVIPDIHNQFSVAENIISREKPNFTVFLGDYFDSYGDDPDMAIETALWLKRSLYNKKRIHLIGNHDISYMTSNPRLKCTGFTDMKRIVISHVNVPWDRMYYYWWVDDWLCTHSGLSNSFFEKYRYEDDLIEFLKRTDIDDALMDNPMHKHRFFQSGPARGGDDVPGILWCDYSEFVNIPNVKQLFGHTKDSVVRHSLENNGECYCLDTSLNDYALIIDGQISIQSV